MVNRKSKKGSIRDLFFLIGFLFGLGLMFFIGFAIYNLVTDELKNTEIGDVPEAVAAMDEVGVTISQVDYFFMIVFFMMVIAMLVSAFMVDVHPIFYVIFIIAWIIAVMFSTILSVTYSTMITATDFFNNTVTGVAATMPVYNFLMTNLPLYTTVLGFLLVLVMFVKTRSRNSYTGV